MANSLLDHLVSIVVFFSAAVILRIILRFSRRQEDDNPIDVVTQETVEDTEQCEGCILFALRILGVPVARAPPALPQPVTMPPPCPSGLISDTIQQITDTFYTIFQFIPFMTAYRNSSNGDA
ncbi:hypothetical protein F5146DRAFT_1124682 [Armillaria mellea]|nr:hypothetical protein F5146DRAFT_1124682 [Armillaria mellea]